MAQKLEKTTVSITINKGRKMTEIIKEIESRTGLSFVYNPDQLQQKNMSLSGDFNTEPVRSLLDRLGLQVLEKGGYVILNNAVMNKPDRIITGVVKDTTGLALPGVSVKVLGTQSGTITDGNGAYRIAVAADAVLSFSMIGYQTMEAKVGENQVINMVLKEERSTLADVVVVGYGTQKKKP
ncbi:carboxypeptidase-like regulatory domain-containing protein [Pedobacter sp. P26]|uniref:carboxypeptidase-like regulatory domain-containing protein n=1 Tax=Pedobacter sp. P26 TaxID=3423956 RepID=UPI003D6793EE